MKKLLIYLKDYKKETILSPLFKLLEAVFELFVPLVMAGIIDYGIANSDKGYITRMCLLLIALGIIGLVCSITAQYYAAKAAVGLVTKIRHVLFKHIQKFSYSQLDQIGIPTIITRMTGDINQVQNGVNLTLRLLLRSPLIVFGAMIMAFTIDFKAALVFAVSIPILAVIIFVIMLWCIPKYKEVQMHLDKVLTVTRENLSGVRVIRAFCKEKEETQKFKEQNDFLTNMQNKVGYVSSLLNPLTYVVVNLSIIVLIWIGAIRVEQGIITQGAVVALYNYMTQILVELIKLANFIINVTKSVACGNRIQSILEIDTSQTFENEHSISENFSDVAVEFKNVSLKYKKASDESLSNISFKAMKGETIGVIGGTGSGKTSLVNLIPRFYDASSGEVLVNGINVNDYSVIELRKKIGVVPQKSILFKGTIRDNMLWGNEEATDEEILEAIKTAQAKEIIDKKENGLDYIIEQGGKNLSGGQRQRFTIARAIVRNPEILILDDSSSALDFATEAELRKSIKNLKHDMTVFIVSQRASSIRHANKIIVLDDGKAVGIGTHQELLESCNVYKEIYYSQFKKEEIENEKK